MAGAEFIDLYSENNTNDNQIDFDFEKDNIFETSNSKIEDFKHQTNSIKKVNKNYKNEIYNDFDNIDSINKNNSIKKNYSIEKNKNEKFEDLDDKIIWAGAIFIFFGVFLFLMGYWLGKTMIRELNYNNNQKLVETQEKLLKTKTENNLVLNKPIIVTENQPQLTYKVEQNENITPKVQETPIENKTINVEKDKIKQESNKHEKEIIIAPPIKPSKLKEKEKKITEKKVESLEKKEIKLPKKTEGEFIIQVSAHSSFEKARIVEDKLRQLGLKSYIVEANVNGINFYRVRVGKFNSREEAEIALNKIHNSSLGKIGFIFNIK